MTKQNDPFVKSKDDLLDFYEVNKDRVSPEHIDLMICYGQPLNISKACNLVHWKFGYYMCPGRKGSPYTQELVELGLIRRINPGSSCRAGYRHQITELGIAFIQLRRQVEDSLIPADFQPEFS